MLREQQAKGSQGGPSCQPPAAREGYRRGMPMVARRVHAALADVILPLATVVARLPRSTAFVHTEEDAVREVFQRARYLTATPPISASGPR